MSEFTTKQASGIARFFNSLGIAPEDHDARRLTLSHVVDLGRGGNGKCEVCGHGGLRWEFHLTDEDEGGDLIAGSDCIETFLGANEVLLGDTKRRLKQAKEDAKRRQREEEREKNLSDLRVAWAMIHALAEQVNADESQVLNMLQQCIDRGERTRVVSDFWAFTEKRREWARGRVRYLRARKEGMR